MARRLSSRSENGAGHNSSGMTDREGLKRHVDSILKLMGDRDEINDAIKERYENAKEAGFVPKILRKIVAELRMDAEVRQEQYNLLDEYRLALGLLADTPLGEAAIEAAQAEGGEIAQLIPRQRRGRRRSAEAIRAAQDHLGELEPPAA